MKKLLVFMVAITVCINCSAQTNDFQKAYGTFKDNALKAYSDFRDEANSKYAEFLKEAWKQYRTMPAVPRPKDEDKPPVVINDKERSKPIEDRPVPIKDMVTPPQPEPQPVPVAPIKKQPAPQEQWRTFTLYGTEMKVRFSDSQRFRLSGCSEQAVATAWQQLSADNYNNTIRDCLALRMTKKLGDWAYLHMLSEMAKACIGTGNEAVLLTAYVYCQSGYQMRLATADGRLYMLYASKHTIYGKNYFNVDGTNYYVFGGDVAQLHICSAAFPQEKPLSLLITGQQELSIVKSAERTLTSKRYPDMKATLSVNKNLIDFYNNYPTSCIGKDFMTRWAMYANTPIEPTAGNSLYPALREAVGGLGEKEAVERLLNWVQTAFVYEYDDKVWGHDRAFFAEESLYYPYCDCEDRSILLSRLVRDLLGLKCILIYYPGHLAMAVRFTENVKGDYILLNGQRFVVCDPTYIGAPVGLTMPKMDNSKASVILLE